MAGSWQPWQHHSAATAGHANAMPMMAVESAQLILVISKLTINEKPYEVWYTLTEWMLAWHRS